jgi:hypothetical protein
MPDRETLPPTQPPAPGTTRITQGHPTYAEPGADKGGEAGAPKPNERTPHGAADAAPTGGADAGASQDDPGRGGD